MCPIRQEKLIQRPDLPRPLGRNWKHEAGTCTPEGCCVEASSRASQVFSVSISCRVGRGRIEFLARNYLQFDTEADLLAAGDALFAPPAQG